MAYEGYLVIDFTATSLKDMKIHPQEIIEIQARVIDPENFQPISSGADFSSFIKPVHRPKLSPYCLKTTGFKQLDIENAKAFRVVFKEFMAWLNKQDLEGKRNGFIYSPLQ
jgi:3'-5' exoribonuclease 1